MRLLVPLLVSVGLALVVLGLLVSFYTDLLWFRSIGFTEVLTTEWVTRAGLFVGFGVAMALIVGLSGVIAYRTRPEYRPVSGDGAVLERYRQGLEPFRRAVVVFGAGGLILLAGASAATQWQQWLQFVNSEPFGTTDAQFGMDISFYVFQLPFLRFVLGFFFSAMLLSLALALVVHYLYGGLRIQPGGIRATPAARIHLSVLLALFMLGKAVAYWLDRYSLGLSERGAVTGWSYTDVNAVLPAKTILMFVALICAVLFVVNAVQPRWSLAGAGLAMLVLSSIIVGGVYPALVQQFQVRPSEVDKEADYIARNIDATRKAYDIADVQFEEYSARTSLTPSEVGTAANAVPGVRLLDPNVLSPTFRQLQQVRGFYSFNDSLDVDRYVLDGKRRDAVVAVREVATENLPAQQRNWINEHLVYTHGFGFVAAPGNRVDSEGRPIFVEGDLNTSGTLGDYEQRIYFGEKSPSYSIVGAPKGTPPTEFDYPTDSASGQVNNTYTGKGGVAIGNRFVRLLYGVKFGEVSIVLNNRVNEESKVLYIRNPRDRVEKVAPYLTIDGDPYPTVVDGRIQWVLDGYTTSNGYPYAEPRILDVATRDTRTTSGAVASLPSERVNYIRNSVKATVDAYDGTVKLYAWDDKDPVLKVWQKSFPGTILPAAQMSPTLREHVRYPEDLFKVQRDLLSRYHVSDPRSFYGGQDFWGVPDDPTKDGPPSPQPPYYLTVQMPGNPTPAYSLTTVFTFRGRPNLAAFMAVSSDPGNDYGRLRVLQLPRNLVIDGPGQVQNKFKSDPVAAPALNLLTRGGNSSIVYGNLLTLPVAGGLMYVEPVYVQAATGSSFPLLRKVLVSYGDRIAFEDSLDAALRTLFGPGVNVPGGGGSTPTPSPSPGTGSPTPAPSGSPATGTLDAAIADAQSAYDRGQEALAQGDFAAYGKAQAELKAALDRAAALANATEPPSPAPTPSTSPSAAGLSTTRRDDPSSGA